jgi:hypothetical protein
MKKLFLAFILSCLAVSVFSAQTNQNNPFKGALIPARLIPLLTKRTEQFVEIQRQEKWELLFDFLLPNPKKTISDVRKQCIVEQFKDNSMLDFTIHKTSMTTANIGKPLNERIWFIQGDAELKTDSGKSKQSISITARYFNRNWFFSIPEFYHQKWEDKKLAQANLSAEMKELLQVIDQPDSPIEIFDISVKIRPTSYTLRDYSFKVRNKTKKTIISYGYKLIESGQTVGSPNDIKPNESASNSGFYGANYLFCEDQERPVRIYITDVQFENEKEWKSNLSQHKRL